MSEITTPSKKEWDGIYRAFNGEDYAFVDDPDIRAYMEIYSGYDTPEEAAQSWALARYYSQMNREGTRLVHDNLESAIRHYHGKDLSIPEAFAEVRGLLNGEQFKGVTIEDRFIFLVSENAELIYINGILLCKATSVLLLLWWLISFVILQIKKHNGTFEREKALRLERERQRKLDKEEIKRNRKGKRKMRKEKLAELCRKLADRDKISFVFLFLALSSLVIGCVDLIMYLHMPAGFYTILRALVCGISMFHIWNSRNWIWKSILIILALIYNPVFPIHLEEKEFWFFINIISFFVLLISGIIQIKKIAETVEKEKKCLRG